MIAPRSIIEERILLASGDKLLCVIVTFLHRNLLSDLSPEAFAATLTFVLAVFAWMVWLIIPSRRVFYWTGLISAGLSIWIIIVLVGFDVQSLHLQPPTPLLLKDFEIPPSQFRLKRGDVMSFHGKWFMHRKTNHTLLLRGVNLGGSSKIPANGYTETGMNNTYASTPDSFVGRALPLDKADEHFARLANLGLFTHRLLITWEAVEPNSPGVYDRAYLAYLKSLVQIGKNYGHSFFIDPHQDVWSRFTGGDGAPRWTLEKVGFITSHVLHDSGATLLHNNVTYPRMCWASNYARLATATMFTLFFAGDRFAPATLVDGIPVQTYLQDRYVAMLTRVMEELKYEDNVLGVDTMNEPSNGYVTLHDLRQPLFPVPLAQHLSAFDGMVLGAGFTRPRVDYFSAALIYSSSQTVNPFGYSVWQSPDKDVWRANGVWDIDPTGQPRLLLPHHFTYSVEKFAEHFMAPFYVKISRAIKNVDAKLIIFAEPVIFIHSGRHSNTPILLDNPAIIPPYDVMESRDTMWAWAPHWYDAAVLMTKTYLSWFYLAVDRPIPVVFGGTFVDAAIEHAAELLFEGGAGLGGGEGGATLIGETGIPFDMHLKQAYGTGDFTMQVRAMDRTLRNFETKFLSWTLWNYCWDNTNAAGEHWNEEDLSLFSVDQMIGPKTGHDMNLFDGIRAVQAISRPYPLQTWGTPIMTRFDAYRDIHRKYELEIQVGQMSSAAASPVTIVFIPVAVHYGKGIDIVLSCVGDTWKWKSHNLLEWTHVGCLGSTASLLVQGKS